MSDRYLLFQGSNRRQRQFTCEEDHSHKGEDAAFSSLLPALAHNPLTGESFGSLRAFRTSRIIYH
jgi:hypothetical protein